MSYELAEIRRRLANILRTGTIGQLSAGSHTATVVIEDDDGVQLSTDPRPWLTGRAGPDSDWHAPEEGEQVMLLSPDGEMANGVILPGMYSDAYPAPANSADIWRKKFKDGTTIEYDRAKHELTVDLGVGSALVIAKRVDIDAEATNITGHVVIGKSLTVMGGSALNGGVSAKPGEAGGSAMLVNGVIEATDDVVASGVSVKGHDHGGIVRGGDRTDGPK